MLSAKIAAIWSPGKWVKWHIYLKLLSSVEIDDSPLFDK